MKQLNTSNTPTTKKDLAQTPQWFIDNLCLFLGIPGFDLDVCAQKETSKGYNYYSLDEGKDGLKENWEYQNWCNPPFSNIQPWIDKAIKEALNGLNTAMLLPNNPETKYIRQAKKYADTIIEMPFRLKFLKPDGTPFLDKNNKEQSPQFSCLIAVFTPIGLRLPTRFTYVDFRNYPDQHAIKAQTLIEKSKCRTDND